MKYFGIYLIVINVITFFVYGIDKRKAKKKKWRIPERTLMIFALIGGFIGAYCGMKMFHHKTMHRKFTIGIPFIAFLWIAIFIYLCDKNALVNFYSSIFF